MAVVLHLLNHRRQVAEHSENVLGVRLREAFHLGDGVVDQALLVEVVHLSRLDDANGRGLLSTQPRALLLVDHGV